MLTVGKCKICGEVLHPPRRIYCSDTCAKVAANLRKKVTERKQRDVSPMYYSRVCPDCGRTVLMHIKSKRCQDCQREADKIHDREYKRAKSAGHTRKIGDMYPCERCGQMYELASGKQRYCKACAETATRNNILALKRSEQRDKLSDPVYRAQRNASRRSRWQIQHRTCCMCGATFLPPTPRRKTCSEKCQADYRKQQQRASDAKRLRRKKKEETP